MLIFVKIVILSFDTEFSVLARNLTVIIKHSRPCAQDILISYAMI